MRPKAHFFIGIIFIIFLHFIFPQITFLNLMIILFSSVLIDVDHYFYYIAKTKNFSLIKCYQWFDSHLRKTLALPLSERKKIHSGFYIFHGVEMLVITFLLGIFVSQLFIFIFVGFFLHFVVDVPHEYYIKRTIHKISIIYSYYAWKKLEG
jgi:hypothetical protein